MGCGQSRAVQNPIHLQLGTLGRVRAGCISMAELSHMAFFLSPCELAALISLHEGF